MRCKTSKKNSKKFFYLSIIESISKYNKLPKVTSKQNLNYYVKTLKTNGLIHMKGYGTWELTALGKEYLPSKQVKKTNLDTLALTCNFNKIKKEKQTTWLRSHGFMWSIKCPFNYRNVKKSLRLTSHKLDYVELNKGIIKFNLYGHNIHLNSRTITVWFDKHFYYKSKTATEGYRMAVQELKRLLTSIENILSVSLRIKRLYKFKPCKKHFGNVNNELAKLYHRDHKTMRIFDKGKEWLLMDFSDGSFVELETTDNDRNIIDNDFIITPFFNTLRHDPYIVTKLVSENTELKLLISENQKMLKHLLGKENTSIDIDRFKY